MTMIVAAGDADVWADEPIWKDGAVVGFVPVDMITPAAAFEIEILGEIRPATLITEPLFDPKGGCLRG